MTVETHVHKARQRVQAERGLVTEKRDALRAFLERVRALPASSPNATTSAGTAAVAGAVAMVDVNRGPDCGAVRTAFAETVLPHADADGHSGSDVQAGIARELTDELAVALGPNGGNQSFTSELQRALVAETELRLTECRALSQALAREVEELDAAADRIDDLVDWLVDADETSLTELGFEELRSRHETLDRHREQCRALLRDRQSFLNAVTSVDGAAGVSHRTLVNHLYEDCNVAFPVLATGTRLQSVCRECQRSIRAHVVRRA